MSRGTRPISDSFAFESFDAEVNKTHSGTARLGTGVPFFCQVKALRIGGMGIFRQ